MFFVEMARIQWRRLLCLDLIYIVNGQSGDGERDGNSGGCEGEMVNWAEG